MAGPALVLDIVFEEVRFHADAVDTVAAAAELCLGVRVGGEPACIVALPPAPPLLHTVAAGLRREFAWTVGRGVSVALEGPPKEPAVVMLFQRPLGRGAEPWTLAASGALALHRLTAALGGADGDGGSPSASAGGGTVTLCDVGGTPVATVAALCRASAVPPYLRPHLAQQATVQRALARGMAAVGGAVTAASSAPGGEAAGAVLTRIATAGGPVTARLAAAVDAAGAPGSAAGGVVHVPLAAAPLPAPHAPRVDVGIAALPPLLLFAHDGGEADAAPPPRRKVTFPWALQQGDAAEWDAWLVAALERVWDTATAQAAATDGPGASRRGRTPAGSPGRASSWGRLSFAQGTAGTAGAEGESVRVGATPALPASSPELVGLMRAIREDGAPRAVVDDLWDALPWSLEGALPGTVAWLRRKVPPRTAPPPPPPAPTAPPRRPTSPPITAVVEPAQPPEPPRVATPRTDTMRMPPVMSRALRAKIAATEEARRLHKGAPVIAPLAADLAGSMAWSGVVDARRQPGTPPVMRSSLPAALPHPTADLPAAPPLSPALAPAPTLPAPGLGLGGEAFDTSLSVTDDEIVAAIAAVSASMTRSPGHAPAVGLGSPSPPLAGIGGSPDVSAIGVAAAAPHPQEVAPGDTTAATHGDMDLTAMAADGGAAPT